MWDFLQKCLVKGSLCITNLVSYWASLFKNVNCKSAIKRNKASCSPKLEKLRKNEQDQEVWFQGVFFTCTLRSVINSQSLFYSTQRSTIEIQSHTFMVAFGGREGGGWLRVWSPKGFSDNFSKRTDAWFISSKSRHPKVAQTAEEMPRFQAEHRKREF